MKPRAAYPSGRLLAVCALALGFGCRRPAAVPGPGAPAQKPSNEPNQASTPYAAEAEAEATPVHESAAGPNSQTTVDASVGGVVADATSRNEQSDAASPTGERPEKRSPGACKSTRARIEDALRRAARCDAHEECTMAHVHYAFGCRTALRKNAPLDALREEATRYAAGCNLHLGVVRCVYHTGALCTRHRCTLASPEELQAADVQPERIGF